MGREGGGGRHGGSTLCNQGIRVLFGSLTSSDLLSQRLLRTNAFPDGLRGTHTFAFPTGLGVHIVCVSRWIRDNKSQAVRCGQTSCGQTDPKRQGFR